jgi:predicted aspartyl protease
MIVGIFGENGELLFEIDLIAANGEQFPLEVLLDTGFTTGWLAINSQDLEALQWTLIASQIEMQTARGKEFFDLYEGQVIIDGKEFRRAFVSEKTAVAFAMKCGGCAYIVIQ